MSVCACARTRALSKPLPSHTPCVPRPAPPLCPSRLNPTHPRLLEGGGPCRSLLAAPQPGAQSWAQESQTFIHWFNSFIQHRCVCALDVCSRHGIWLGTRPGLSLLFGERMLQRQTYKYREVVKRSGESGRGAGIALGYRGLGVPPLPPVR